MRIFIFLCFFFFSVSQTVSSQSVKNHLPPKAVKMIEKAVDKEDYLSVKMKIPAGLFPELEATEVFEIKVVSREIYYLVLASGQGRTELFDYGILFDNSLRIKDVVVITYRSSYGGEISSKRWLRQFEGHKPGTILTYGRDIDAISGATFSGRSITTGVQNLSIQLKEYIQYLQSIN